MPAGNVDWFSFDPETGVFPEQVEPSLLPESGRGRIVVLAAVPSSETGLWAGWTTMALAGHWASLGLRIFLMDLGLQSPVLHKILGVENDEGVSDAFLYGASIQRIARPALEGAIFFAPAGTASGDPEEVLNHSRWEDLVGGFSEADATLLLYLPTGLPGADKIFELASDIVFLGSEGEDSSAHLGPAAVKVMAALGPPGVSAGAVPPRTPESEEAPVDVDGGEDLPLDLTESLSLAPGFEEALERGASLDEGQATEVETSYGTLEGLESTPSHVREEDDEVGSTAGGLEGLTLDRGSEGETAPDEEADQDADSGAEEHLGGYRDEIDLDDAPASDTMGGEQGDDVPTASEFSAAFQAGQAEEGVDFAPESLPDPDVGLEMDFLDADPGTGSAPEPSLHGGAASAESGGEEEGVSLEASARESRRRGRSPQGSTARRRSATQRPRAAAPRRSTTPTRLPWNRVGLLVLVIAAVTAVAGAVTGLLTVPGLAVFQGVLSGLPDPELVLEGPEASGPVMRYSLHLFSYDEDELVDAWEMKAALEERLPEITFFISPMGGQGRSPYLLLAGPAQNRSQAESLRSPLSRVLDREDPYSWTVRETPRAFFLGERATLQEAESLGASLETQEIDPYVMEVSYPDGSAGFRVLAGAFTDVGESRILQRILSTHGVQNPPLIERTGRSQE